MTISCQRIPYTKAMAQTHHHAVRVRSQEFHDKVKLAMIDRDMVGDIMVTKEGIVVGSIIAISSNKNLIRLSDERVPCEEDAVNISRQERLEQNAEKEQRVANEWLMNELKGHPERAGLTELGF